MSTLSAAKQIEASYSASSNAPSPTSNVGTDVNLRGDILEMPRFPNFAPSAKAQSDVSRMANRVNARAISEADHKLLLSERQALLDKEFEGSIGPEEKNRLAYVRWSLDRVDDARYGADLDRLEGIVYQYERFQQDIEKFQAELERLSKSRRSYP